MGVTLVTYPLSVERTVQGSEPSNEPVVAHGRVNEIVPGAEKAIGSYHGNALAMQRLFTGQPGLVWGLNCCCARSATPLARPDTAFLA